MDATGGNDGTGRGLVEFLDWTGEKGELNKRTADAMKGSSRAVLSVEGDPEAVNLRETNLEQLAERFTMLNRTRYSTSSLDTYVSRFRTSTAMYLAWLAGDSGWKLAGKSVKAPRQTAPRARPKRDAPKAVSAAVSDSTPAENEAKAGINPPPLAHRLVAYDWPLRPDLVVRVTLPIDMTQDDADRLAGFAASLVFKTKVEPKPVVNSKEVP